MTLPNTTGGPDFNAQPASNPSAPGFDQAEVVGRLLMGGGSVSRTGRVIWATGFENGLASDYSFGMSAGGISAPRLGDGLTGPSGSILSAWQGSYYHLLQTGTVNGNFASFFKYFPATIQTGRWGFELMFQIDTFNTTLDIVLKKVGPSGIPGAQTFTGIIRLWASLNNANIFLQYQDSTPAFQTFATLSNIFAVGTNVWYNAKLVVDFTAGKYVRFLLNNKSYDLSAFAMQATAAGVDEKSSAQVIATTLTAASSVAGIDNLILTSDEP